MKLLIGAASALALMAAGGVFAQTVDLGPSAANATGGGQEANADSPNSVLADPFGPGFGSQAAGTDISGSNASANDGQGNSGVVSSVANGALLIQEGVDNDGFIVQLADNDNSENQAVLIQNGEGNFGLILQEEDFNEAAGVQLGENNVLVIRQREEGNESEADQQAAVFQWGDDNTALVDQLGDSNAAALVQAGDDNEAAILQASQNNADPHQSAAAVQFGNDNSLFIAQNMGSVDGIMGTFGPGVIEIGGVNPTTGISIDADVIYDGNPDNDVNVAGPAVLDSVNNAAAVQIGDNNAAAIIQNGNGNNGGIVQVSN